MKQLSKWATQSHTRTHSLMVKFSGPTELHITWLIPERVQGCQDNHNSKSPPLPVYILLFLAVWFRSIKLTVERRSNVATHDCWHRLTDASIPVAISLMSYRMSKGGLSVCRLGLLVGITISEKRVWAFLVPCFFCYSISWNTYDLSLMSHHGIVRHKFPPAPCPWIPSRCLWLAVGVVLVPIRALVIVTGTQTNRKPLV